MFYGIKIKEESPSTATDVSTFLNTYTDSHYKLILAADYTDSPPEQRRESVKLAGVDGKVELSYIIRGDPIYENRTLEFTLCGAHSELAFIAAHSLFLNSFHGRMCKVIMPWSDNLYYYGNVSVGKKSDYGVNKFTVTVDAEPYLYTVLDDQRWSL